jgi:hypothetical protein
VHKVRVLEPQGQLMMWRQLRPLLTRRLVLGMVVLNLNHKFLVSQP